MDFLTKYIRPVVELVYFIASIGLSATIFIGLKQLKLVKDDIKIRNKRASVEKSIEYLHWFATDYIPQISEVRSKVPSKFNNPSQLNKKFVFDHNCNPKTNSELLPFYTACHTAGVVNLLNQLEYFSAAMMNGLADEELAFNPLADTYCSTVEEFYVIICAYRLDENSRMYTYIIGLYSTWKSRLDKLELENKKREIDESISKIDDRRITSIGV